MNNTGGRRFGKIELQPSFIGKLLLRASANERLIRTGALLILAAGVASLAVLGVSLIKPGILGAPGHILQEKASELIQHAFSSGTLKLVAAVAVVIAIDLWALGYKNSALNSLLHPDKSTRTGILIFLLGIAGLSRYAIILSFFAVGYLLERQVTANWGQNWMQLIPNPIVQT
ncbi:MAG: hypothetical protein HKP25_03040, partial [Marinicaulis sp.]|nr:hypothetical protein [Marinicaulis sp.]